MHVTLSGAILSPPPPVASSAPSPQPAQTVSCLADWTVCAVLCILLDLVSCISYTYLRKTVF